uniref:Uncharacterized protein n=1 Tax=Glossina pallidipes TaxID=7398 RepID=A0A1A9Z203_GLOPL
MASDTTYLLYCYSFLLLTNCHMQKETDAQEVKKVVKIDHSQKVKKFNTHLHDILCINVLCKCAEPNDKIISLENFKYQYLLYAFLVERKVCLHFRLPHREERLDSGDSPARSALSGELLPVVNERTLYAFKKVISIAMHGNEIMTYTTFVD